MKKILSLLGTITLIETSTTSLVACNTPQEKEYTPEELADLKKDNQINTTNETIKNNLERIAPQEKPFNTVDNKWYFVVWKPNNENFYKISKFKNDTNSGKEIEIWDPTKPYDTAIYLWVFETKEQDLLIIDYLENAKRLFWSENRGHNFKAVYRWNSLDKTKPNLVIDDKNNVKVN